MRLHWIAPALAAMLLFGCASQPLSNPQQQDAEAHWAQQRVALEKVTQFVLQGRIASGGAFGLSGGMRWTQNADGSFSLFLSGPFGAGALSISGTERQVEVRSKDGVTNTSDPQGWIFQKTGWMLPVGELRWWALGLPSPRSPAQLQLDGNGRPATLSQNGWTLEYHEYQQVGGLTLPRKFEASNGDAHIKIVADRWTDLPAGL